MVTISIKYETDNNEILEDREDDIQVDFNIKEDTEVGSIICGKLKFKERNGSHWYYDQVDNGCLTINLYDEDGDLAARQEHYCRKNNILHVEGRHGFTCSCW